jgi:hypothetical protein
MYKMDSTDLIRTDDFPKPMKGRQKGKNTALKTERKRMAVEAAAIAYVQMENGEYRYSEGTKRQWLEDGSPTINKSELMRRAGYSPGSWKHFDDYLATQDEFWELVELHRLRRTDPMFRREQESALWLELGGEALRNLYERLYYSPHSLSTEQHIKIVKLILDAGITFQKLGEGPKNKTSKLLDTLEPESRKKAMDGYEDKLRKELEDLESLKKAHNAADRE